MSSTNLQDKIIEAYGGLNDGVYVQFKVNETEFVFTRGVIYKLIDGRFTGGHKKAKTLRAVIKFVETKI